MIRLIFGTAQLFREVDPDRSAVLLSTAYDSGIRHFDTAPSYGYGEGEPAVGALRTALSARGEQFQVTTKVGIAPTQRPGRAIRTAKWAAGRLPESYKQRLRPDRAPGTGQFQPQDVSASVEQSLHRLGRIDRLMLHEITPAEITPELLTQLLRYRDRGDIGQLGIATSIDLTRDCLDRAGDAFEAVHLAAGPATVPPTLPDFVTVRVGHGLLGPGGAELTRLAGLLRSDPQLADSWRDATRGTRWQSKSGLAELLLARAGRIGLTDVIVATSRPDRLAPIVELFDTDLTIEAPMLAVLDRLIEAAQPAGSAGAGPRTGRGN